MTTFCIENSQASSQPLGIRKTCNPNHAQHEQKPSTDICSRFSQLNTQKEFLIFFITLLFLLKLVVFLDMDPYDILNISPDSSFQTIRKAYLSLAKEYHPDKQNLIQNSENFHQIKNAFDSLKDNRRLIDINRLTQESVIQEEIDFSELEHENDNYFFECRCGSDYSFTMSELGTFRLENFSQVLYVSCESCSGLCKINL